ncbi:hypothetical protein EAG_13981 [Camponotus floridanus]|uniref:Uncharacterized protein n=1 Tax=Camponotus floridanus TaxID=104421 RepID=E2A3G5_CAMFO|nr:hypothetical protein EAG_13981 [Camponotus floridanus]
MVSSAAIGTVPGQQPTVPEPRTQGNQDPSDHTAEEDAKTVATSEIVDKEQINTQSNGDTENLRLKKSKKARATLSFPSVLLAGYDFGKAHPLNASLNIHEDLRLTVALPRVTVRVSGESTSSGGLCPLRRHCRDLQDKRTH